MADKEDADLDGVDQVADGETEVLGGGGEGGGKKDGDDLEVVIETGDAPADGSAEGGEAAGEGDGEGESEEDDSALGADEAPADDLKDLKPNMRKRVERERRIRREVETERDQERVARGDAEIRLRSSQKLNIDLAVSNLNFQITAKQAELVKAKEAGKTEDEVKLQTDLGDLQGKKRDAENAKARLEHEEEQAKQRGGGGDGKKAKNPLTERWTARNKWFDDDRFKIAAGTARLIDRDMVAEGYRPDSEAYYVELDKRIHKEMPHLRSKIRQSGYGPRVENGGGQQRPQQRPQGGALPVRTQTQRPAQSKSRVVLTRADQENMSRFGMDPTRREDQIAYARQKLEGSKA